MSKLDDLKARAAHEVCEHCHRAVWFDPEQEVYLNAKLDGDCPDNPPRAPHWDGGGHEPAA